MKEKQNKVLISDVVDRRSRRRAGKKKKKRNKKPKTSRAQKLVPVNQKKQNRNTQYVHSLHPQRRDSECITLCRMAVHQPYDIAVIESRTPISLRA